MIAFILGGLTAIALLKIGRRVRCGRGHMHHGWHGHWHDEDEHIRHGMRMRGPFVLRFLSDRLQTTPTQERAMAEAIDEFMREVHALEDEGKKTRADVAAAMRKPSFDEVLLGELYARHDAALEKLRKAFVGLGAKVHDTLDEEQRERLADLIERGPRFFRRRFGW
jgi:hypothetical protein